MRIDTSMRPRADYQVIKTTEQMVWLIDLDKGSMSVTNDAERVVASVNATWPERRIIYRDSMGQWGELMHEGGRFITFRPTPELDPGEAAWIKMP